jgi:predicted esterase
MKTFPSILRLPAILLICLITHSVRGQQMLNPQDSVINYNPAAPPVQPAFGKIGKWVRTPSLPWNTTAYKCYIYDSCDFRLHFPQTYQPGDGKKYPILIFYNGNGEEGPITDDESQLKNGGLMFDNAEVNGTFDGYILFMQDQHGYTLVQCTAIRNLIDTLVQEYGGDPYRVIANGLSGGGQGIFDQLGLTPTYFAGAVIMSAALELSATPAEVNTLKFTPIWDLDGGLDNDPTPAQARYVDSAYLSLGSNYTYKNYPTLGHDTWDSTWLEPNFWPFVNNAYQSNPWTLFGKTVFCPGQSFKITIGVVPGLDGYQWRLNGAVIPSATTDSLVVTQPGTYDARVLRGSTWSDWSHVPVKILGQVPAPTADIVQPSCTVSTGTINVAQPISAGLSYSIDSVHYQTDTVFSKLAAGKYTLRVKEDSTCMSTPTTVVINAQPVTPAQPAVTITQPTCTAKGIIALTSSDTGLAYSINNGQYYVTYDRFTGLVPGTYWPKVKNGAGCSSSFMVSVINPGPPIPPAPAVTVTQPTCTVGTGAISISPPVDSFTYSIGNGGFQAGGSFTGVAVGSYNVTAENSEGCISSPTVAAILTPPAAPAAPVVTVTQPTCTVSMGTISISGGTDSLRYSLNNGAWQSSGVFSSLAAGSYQVMAENSVGCVSSPSTATVFTQPSTPATPGLTVTQPTCTVAAGTIAVTSPIDTLSYNINNGSYQPGGSWGGLAAGTYAVTARNSAGCVSAAFTSVILVPPGTPPAPVVTVIQPTCTVGTGTISVSSAVDSFTYSISNVNYPSGSSFTGLAAGSYNVTAENSEGCISPPTAAIVLAPPSAPAAPVVTVTQPTCTIATGVLSISGSADSLSYSLNNGAWQSGGVFNDVAAGSYQVTAENSGGCVSSPSTVTVNSPPSTPATPGLTVTQPTCTVATGTISVTSPIDTLSYNINNSSYQPGGNFTGLAAGSYAVTAQNSAGCVSAPFTSVILMQPGTPPAPVVTVIQPTCAVATGTITITSPVDSLSYSINNSAFLSSGSFNNLTSGSYSVTAENSAGCISSPSIAVILPAPAAPPAPEVTIVQPTCSVTTGSIAVTGSSGVGLLYSINDTTYQPETSFINLLPGSYPVTVRDSDGCVSSVDVAVISSLPASCSIVISVYPNPYAGEVNFTIVSPETGKGLLVFYNLLGERMNAAIEQDFTAGMPTSIRCPMGFAHGQAVVYQFMMGKKKWQGTLLPLTF